MRVFNMREERWDSKNIRVREERNEKQMMVAERKSKSEKLRSMQRDHGGDNAYKVHIAYHKYTYVTNCGEILSEKNKNTED